MGAPGWPLLACCTASIARVRIVLMHSVSSCLPVTNACSLATMRFALLEGQLQSRPPTSISLEFPGQKRVSEPAPSVSISCEPMSLDLRKAGSVKNGETRREEGKETKTFYFSNWR